MFFEQSRCDDIRRCEVQRSIKAERLISETVAAVGKLPGDVRLNDPVSLLQATMNRLADYVDGIPGHRTCPVQALNQYSPET